MSDIKEALSVLEKNFGKESYRMASSFSDIEAIPTGIQELDNSVLGIGGFPRGRIVECWGAYKTGKTTMALHLIANAQKQDAVCVYFDLEHRLDFTWAKKAGVDIDSLIIPDTKYGEDTWEKVKALIGVADVIVVDSIPFLRSKELSYRGIEGVARVGANARMNDIYLGDILAGSYTKKGKIINQPIDRTKTCLLLVNQLRAKIGIMYGPSQGRPGGNALDHATSIILKFDVGGFVKDSNDEIIKQKVRIECQKNSLATPFRKCELLLDLRDNTLEASNLSYVLNTAVEKGLVTTKGTWLYCDFFPEGKLQGLSQFEEFVNKNPKFVDLVFEDDR